MPDLESLKWGFLVLARITAFFIQAPCFSINGVPPLLKIGLGLLVTIILFPVLPTVDNISGDLINYSVLVIREVIVGLILGYVSSLTFTAIRIAGEVIDIQMGFAMAAVLDPQSQSRITLVGQFMYLLEILLFLAIDGHHNLLLAISYSYEIIPVTGVIFQTKCIATIIKMFVGMFALGIRVAAPFITVFVLSDIALGMVARTVPQLNVFMMGFPIKAGLGLITLTAALPILAIIIGGIVQQMEKDILLVMKLMS